MPFRDSIALACRAMLVDCHPRSRGIPEIFEIDHRRRSRRLLCLASVVLVLALPMPGRAALPKRLVLALDGVAYRDMTALQAGVTYTDLKGRQFHRQAFNEGYFPVSRMISTFPSASDVAW